MQKRKGVHMDGLKPIQIRSAKEKVAEELRRAILSRQLKGGEELSLEHIASQLQVSAMPVREAFQILARDGLIQLRKNKCAIVIGINETYIREHYQIRAILESSAAILACSASDEKIMEIAEVHKATQKIKTEELYGTYADLNRAFHHKIWVAAGNQRMQNMIAELWNGFSKGSMITEADYLELSMEEHAEILDAIQNRDEIRAGDMMKKHIYRSMEDMLTYYQ